MSSILPKRPIFYTFMGIWFVILLFTNRAFSQSCDAPFAQAPDSLTTTSAKLKWISGVADTFELELTASDTVMYGIVTGSNYLWPGLLPATDYTFRVRALCNGMVSNWSNNLVKFSTHLPNPTMCNVHLDIPNASCNYSNDFYIDVADAPGQVLGADVVLKEVKLLIAHTYDQDLTISLVAPDGTVIKLSERNGYEYNNYGNPYDSTCQELTVFADDFCVPQIGDFVATSNDTTNYIGTFRPEEPLALLNATGVNPNGVWKLKICDAQISDLGTLEYAELVFLPISCAAPESPAVSLVGGSFADIEWQLDTNPDSVFIEYGLTDFVPGAGGVLGGGDTIMAVDGALGDVLLQNLVPSTKYYVYLRAQCGNGYSLNTCYTFYTDCADPAFSTDFDNLSACTAKCNVSCNLTGVWQNIANDDNDWVVRSGKTPSFNTGPDADVSGSGNYIYTETSYPCGSGALSVLQSNCIFIGDNVSSNCAFSFQAHMKGSKIGELRLLAHVAGASSWDTLWVAIGAQGNDWVKHYVDLSSYTGQTIQLKFEGVRGGSTGDMALDELIFYGNTLDLGTPNTYFADLDGDGFGDVANTGSFCGSVPPAGFVTDSTDCDDNNDLAYPSAPEIKCNQIDENCNGMADDTILDNPIVNPLLTFCASESMQINVNNAPVGEYYWLSENGSLLGVGQNVTLPNLINSQTIFVVDSTSSQGYTCKSDWIPINITISPAPYIGPDTIVPHCSGQPFLISSLTVEDTVGQAIVTKAFSQLPVVNANEITTDTIFAETYGSFYFQSTTANGCTATKKVDFQVLQSPDVKILPLADTVELCPDEIEVLQAGVVQGVAPYTFDWSNGFDSQIALAQTSSTVAGNYSKLSVELTDVTGCTAFDTVYIGNNSVVTNIEINNLQDVSTCGGSDGQFEIVPYGGVPPYQIEWSGASTGSQSNVLSALVTNLPQGAYNIQITDSSPGSCMAIFTGIIINSPGLSVNLDTVIDVSCYGSTNGAIQLDVTGNNPIYQWSDSNVTTQNRTNLEAGVYNVTVTDANCSLSFDNITVSEPDVIQIFVASQKDVSCYGLSDGTIELNVFGGVKPYNYTWTGPMPVAGDSVSMLAPGTYACEVEDANGCLMGPIQVEVLEPDSLGFSTNITHIDCFGASNGAVEILPFGGVGTYNYLWGDTLLAGKTNQQLAGGIYICTLQDANGCETTDSIEVLESPKIELTSLNVVQPKCQGIDDGVLSALGIGGVGSLAYNWEGFPEGPTIQDLGEGIYSLVVEDALGCHLDTVVIGLSYQKHIQVFVDSIRSVSCKGLSDGYASVFPIGGQFPFQYSWGNASLDSVSAGLYAVTVTDDEGCQGRLDSIQIMEPDSLLLELLTDPVQCYNEASGSVFGFQTGGVSPYQYQWNTGDTLGGLVGVPSGLYQLTVTDAHQCQQFAQAIVEQPDSLVAHVGHVDMVASCGQGASLGSIEMEIQGGVEPYAFDWSNGDTSQNVYNLDTGDYSLTVTDFNGCVVDVKPVTIYNTDLDFKVEPFLVQDIHCNGINDGQIIGNGVGGTMPYNFNWSNGSSTSANWLETPFDTISQLGKGSYNLTITDAKGCTTVSDSFQIDEPTLFHVNLDSVRHNPCGTQQDGQIFTTSAGGIPPYHYLWNTLTFEEDPDSLSVGGYTVTVVDANDCVASLPMPVVLESLVDDFDIDLDTVIHQNCGNFGAINISLPVTVLNPQFLWSTSDTTQNISNLFPGFYAVTVTDENGCTNSRDSIEVKAEPNSLSIVLDSINNVSCFGASDGVIGVSVQDGMPPFTYYWSTNQHDSLSIDSLVAGVYSVTIVDGNSCVVISGGLNVGEPAAIEVAADISDAMITQNGQIFLNITGGIAPYIFQWDASANNQTTNPATNLAPGDYSVTVTDYKGCELIINDLSVGGVTSIEHLSEKKLELYPNPNDGHFWINWPAHLVTDVRLVSPIGLRYAPVVLPQGNQLQVIIQDIPAGIYVVELAQKDGVIRSGLIQIFE